MNSRVLCRDGWHRRRTAEHHRTHIGVLQVLHFRGLVAGSVDLVFRVRNCDAELGRGGKQPFRVLLQLVNAAGIHPLAFEYAGGEVQGMGQDMHFGIAPGHDFAIEPERAVAFVER